MLKENEIKILKRLKNKELVLDIGGWDKPFNRANFVLDIHPFETRGFHGSQGRSKEFFNRKTWVIHDVCSKKRLPFKDNQFDFVICSHVLEDIRDPIWLCAEMVRIAKAGYIETPSMKDELSKGVMDKDYAGYYHHRWLVDIKRDKIVFRIKPHFIHNNKRFHFPRKFAKGLSEKEKVNFLFWNKEFQFEERIQISRDKSEEFIYNYIKENYPRKILYFLLDISEKVKEKFTQMKKKINPRGYYHKYMNTKEFISK
jgi:hypothetical protein